MYFCWAGLSFDLVATTLFSLSKRINMENTFFWCLNTLLKSLSALAFFLNVRISTCTLHILRKSMDPISMCMSMTHLGSGRWTFFIAIIQGCVSTRVANGINNQHLNTSRFGDRDFQKPLGKLTLDTANTQQLPLFIRRLTWNPRIDDKTKIEV